MPGIEEWIVNKATEAAKAAAKAGFDWLAPKAYEQAKPLCGEVGSGASVFEQLFCMALGQLAPAVDPMAQLRSSVDQITSRLGTINSNINIINDNLGALRQDMALLHLEIEELAVGSAAYNALQVIRLYYNRLPEILNDVTRVNDPESRSRASGFFVDVLYKDDLQKQIDIILNALVDPLAAKECLLKNFLAQIAIKINAPHAIIDNKGDPANLVSIYQYYEEYVVSILNDLFKGNVLIEAAVLYFEAMKVRDPAELSRQSSGKQLPPLSSMKWQGEWKRGLERLIDNFNTYLEWFVLGQYAKFAQGVEPFFFLGEAPRRVFWCADYFSSRYTDSYGLRGRIFSMGEQFNGVLTLKDGTRITGKKFVHTIAKKLDYWSATNTSTPKVYNNIVGFSDSWAVHRFQLQSAAAGTREIETALPYSPPEIEIESLPVEGTPRFFGSFAEIARAGGGFAFFSGDWVGGHDDQDSSNQDDRANHDIAKKTEYRKLSEYTIRNGGIIATVQQPEIGVAKGGRLQRIDGFTGSVGQLSGRTRTHLNGSFSTWLETTKTITFPALSNEHVHMVVSLAPTLSKLTDFPDAGKLNAWLKGSVTRVTNPTTDITDAEISKKQVIAGVNYDPRTLGTVVLGLSPDQGCNVEASISLIPVAHEQWTFAATRNPHAWEISEAAAACGPRDPGVFREETKEAPRSVSLQLPFIPETGLTFRFQAHYDLSIETSGVDEGTPFAVYARGKLDNVHFELMPGDMMGAVPMWEPLHTFMGNSDCRCLAFDYDGKKKLDHVIAYVPGDPRNLIFSYGSDGQVRFAQRRMVWKAHSDYLLDSTDRAIAFDFNGTGKLDHLLFYRAASGRVKVLKGSRIGTFLEVHDQTVPRPNSADRVFAFDYNSSGRLDHLVIYTPGVGTFSMISMQMPPAGSVQTAPDGTPLFRDFSVFYTDNSSNNRGIYWEIPGAVPSPYSSGWRDLKNTADGMFAIDHDQTGKLDHLVFYRPGGGELAILKKRIYGHTFERVWSATLGIGDYDLRSTNDRGFAFDYDSSGRLDHLVFYRPGTGKISIFKRNRDGDFAHQLVYHYVSVYNGPGIGGFDLLSPADRLRAFDFTHSGRLDHLMAYRPGSGIFRIIKKNADGSFARIYPA